MSDISKIAGLLAEARKARGLTQKALAQKLAMKQSQISDLEAAKRDFRFSTITEIARAVGLEVVLVPRTLLPAVSYIMQAPVAQDKQQSKYESWDEGDGT